MRAMPVLPFRVAASLPHRLERRWGLLVTLLAGLPPLFWIQSGFVAKSEDFALPLTLDRWAGYFSTWAPDAGLGASPDDRLPAVFFLFWPALFRALGFSIEVAQRLQFMTWFLAAGLAMYFLAGRLSSRELVRAGAVLIYLFNFYQEPMWQGVNIANLSVYAALPLMLGIAIQATRNGSLWIAAGQMALASVIASGAGTNPPMALVAVLPVPLYLLLFIGHRLANGDHAAAWRAARFAGLALALILVASAYWLVPQAVGLATAGPSEIFALAGTRDAAQEQLRGLSQFTPPLNVLRLQGHWIWYETLAGTPYVPHAPTLLASPAAIVASALPMGLAIVGLAIARDRRLLAIGAIGALGLFLSMGVNGPTGFAFAWLWDHVPGFWVLRSPWYKATALTLLGAAPLAGFGIAAIGDWVANSPCGTWARRLTHDRASRAARALGPLTVAAATLVFAGPIVRGDIFAAHPHDAPLPGFQVQVPDHVREAAAWLGEQTGEFRVLAFPPAGRMTTDWGFTSYLTAVSELVPQPPIMTLLHPPEASSALYKALLRGQGQSAVAMLQHAGVRYVMQQDDVNNRYSGPPLVAPDAVAGLLNSQGLEQERAFGPLRFFRVPDEKPRVWATRTIFLAPFELDALPSLSELASEADAAVVLTPRLDPDEAWRLVTDTSARLSMLSFGAETEAFLRLRAQGDALEIAPGASRVTFAGDAPGTYEFWIEQPDQPEPLLRPEERLRFQGGVRRLETRGELVTINGSALEPPPSGSLRASGRWRLIGTAVLPGGPATLELPAPVLGPAPLRVLAVAQRERRQMEVELARDWAVNPGAARWHAFLEARPDDVPAIPRADAVGVSTGSGWSGRQPDDAADGWRRIADVHKRADNLVIGNPRDEVWRVALALRIRSIEDVRSLWVRIVDDAIAIFLVPPGVPDTLIIEGVPLRPGPNAINLYSPDPETELPGPTLASFDFVFPMHAGALSRERAFLAPEAGAYQITVILGGNDDAAPDSRLSLRSLRVDGRDVLPELSVSPGGSVARATMELSGGAHTLHIEQRAGVALPVFIGPKIDRTREPAVQLRTEHLSPTRYRVTASGGLPYLLVVNELYDPRWKASINGREVERHLEVFGSVNGWIVDAGGEHVVDIEFAAQPLADAMRILSIVCLLATALALGIGAVRRRRA